MELARARVELLRSKTMSAQSLVALATAMGDGRWRVKSVAGSLDTAFELPTLELVVANLSAQPESQLADANRRARNARIELAKAERIPDVKVEALYRRLESTRENTFDLGLSIPLPLFNRNHGRLREARAEAEAAAARARLTQDELSLRLHTAHADLTTALANSRTMKTEILPRADTVLKSSEARYQAGDIALAEVLVVRRDWALVQLAWLESLRDVMQAWAELRRFAKPE
jgi:cobalt-zinc-cadmium efflux system outer membrane protein